ncbi:MAG: hypothetical protein NVS9B15_03900 [Acidobacteriaceae bacterium]
MSRCTLRHVLTVLLYAGVAIVLVPYLTGHTTTGLWFLLGGIGLSLVCGFLRCYLTEGDCQDRVPPPFAGMRGPKRTRTQ